LGVFLDSAKSNGIRTRAENAEIMRGGEYKKNATIEGSGKR